MTDRKIAELVRLLAQAGAAADEALEPLEAFRTMYHTASPDERLLFFDRLLREMERALAEFHIAGVYMPPLVVAALLGVAAASLTGRLLDRTRLSRHFFYPPLVFVALVVIYTGLIGTFVIKV